MHFTWLTISKIICTVCNVLPPFTSSQIPCEMHSQALVMFFAQRNPPPSCGSVLPLWRYPRSFVLLSICILQKTAHRPTVGPLLCVGSTGVCTLELPGWKWVDTIASPSSVGCALHEEWEQIQFFRLFCRHDGSIVLIPEDEFSRKVKCGRTNTGSPQLHQNSAVSPEVIFTGSFFSPFSPVWEEIKPGMMYAGMQSAKHQSNGLKPFVLFIESR